MINTDDGQFLVKLARSAIETYLNDGRIINVPQDINPHLKEERGVFVTLHRDGELRGCIDFPNQLNP